MYNSSHLHTFALGWPSTFLNCLFHFGLLAVAFFHLHALRHCVLYLELYRTHSDRPAPFP